VADSETLTADFAYGHCTDR